MTRVDAARISEPWQVVLAAPKILLNLVRCAIAPDSTIVVPHPFHPILALFCLVGKNLILYDDGTASYVESKVPNNRKVRLYMRLSSRLFGWGTRASVQEINFREMVEGSRANQMFAIFPQLQQYRSVRVEPIDLDEAFQEKGGTNTGNSLLLDTHPDISPKLADAEKIVSYFEDEVIAREMPLWYKPHPTGVSEIGRILIGKPWVKTVEMNLEEFLEQNRFENVYSFYSTGAVIAKLVCPETSLFNLPNAQIDLIAPNNKTFFAQIGAVDVEL